MAQPQIVQIRKKGGINKIMKDKNGSTITPTLYKTKTKNRNEEGVSEGDYRGKSLLDTKHFISPIWNDLKKQWSFNGASEDLARLITKMKLRYPKSHTKAGQIIQPGDSVADRLTNMEDEVFTHQDLYGTYFMENSRISLNISDPKQEFLYRCYQSDHWTDDRSSEKPTSKFIASGSKYEIISPKKENVQAKKNADKEIQAITLLAGMNGNEDKMRAIARIMGLPQYSDSTDVAGVFVLLKDSAAQNNNMSAKYRKTYQDRFIELAEMADEDLNINSQVLAGKSKGFLRRRQGFYLFNGERIEGIDTDGQLVNYFRDPKNQDKYLELLDLLENGN